MFDLKKELKKRLCYGFGTYKDNKFGVTYLNLIGGIITYGILLMAILFILYGIVILMANIISRPLYIYNLVLLEMTKIINDPNFIPGLVETGFLFVLMMLLLKILVSPKLWGFITYHHAFVCERFQPSPEVKTIYENIISLDIEKKKEFRRLLMSIDNQITEETKKHKNKTYEAKHA